MTQLKYQLHRDIPFDRAQHEVAEALESGEAKRLIEQAGLDPSLPGLVSLQRQESGLTPGVVAVLVAFAPVAVKLAPVAAKILQDLWDLVILPRLRQKLGQDALEPMP